MVDTKAAEEKPDKETVEEGGSYWEFDDPFEDFEGNIYHVALTAGIACEEGS